MTLLVQRGVDDGNGGSCSDAGTIVVQFKDANPVHKTEYRFKVLDNELFSDIFPDEPIAFTGFYRNNREMFFVWFDLGKTRTEKLDFSLEVTAVSLSGEESEPSKVVVS